MDVKEWNANWRDDDKITKYVILLLNNEVKVDHGRESTPDGEREARNDLFSKLWSRGKYHVQIFQKFSNDYLNVFLSITKNICRWRY